MTVTTTCQCGCGESFEARASQVKAGKAKYKNLSHYGRALTKPDTKKKPSAIRQREMFRSVWREHGLNIRRMLHT